MTRNIQRPVAGTRPSAAWAAAVTDAANSVDTMGPARGLVREGVGFGCEPLPENRRIRSALAGLAPFALRHVSEDEDAGIPYSGWEIYMPAGCVAVGITAQPMNPPATRNVGGESKPLAGWYRLPSPGEDGDDGDVWWAEVHVKCCAAISGVDEFESWPKCYAFAEIHADGRTEEEVSSDMSSAGDDFSVVVGRVDWQVVDAANGTVSPKALNTVRSPVFVRGENDALKPFKLYYAFTVDEQDMTLDVDRLFVRNLSFAAAGASYISHEMYELSKSTARVYLKISTATSPYTGEIKDYDDDDAGEGDEATMTIDQRVAAEKGDTDLMFLLYTLKDYKVTSDTTSVINNIQIYA